MERRPTNLVTSFEAVVVVACEEILLAFVVAASLAVVAEASLDTGWDNSYLWCCGKNMARF